MVNSKKLQLLLISGLLILFITCGFHIVTAQEDVINNVQTAMKTGSSKELSQYFGSIVELNFDGEKSSYSKSQAEFVLKDFFKKNPPIDFQYIHQGSSKQGFKYVIGKYTIENSSFRIWILFKKDNGVYYVDTIDFTRE
jgi:uncharacterized protein YneF (UPF0154 family)